MSRNSSGVYTLPAGNPVVTGTPVSSTVINATLADLAAEVQDSLSRSGRGGMLVPFEHAAGDEAEPGITFAADTGTGFFRAAAGEIGVSSAGSEVARFTPTGMTLTAPLARTSLPVVGQQTSASSGVFTTSSVAYVDVTNLTVTITTTGRPVIVMLQPYSGVLVGGTMVGTSGATANGMLKVVRGIVDVGAFISGAAVAASTNSTFSTVILMDVPAAGTHTYKIEGSVTSVDGTLTVSGMVLTAYEL